MKKSTKIVIVAIPVLLISIFLILYLQLIVNTIYGIDHTSQILDLEMEVTGMKPIYDVGEPITFSVNIKTLGTFVPWPDFRIYKDGYVDNTSEPVFSRNYMTPFEPEDKFNLTAWREQTWNFPLETDTGNPMVPEDDGGVIQFFEEGQYVLKVNAWGKQERLIEFDIRDLSYVIIPQGAMIEGNENLIPKEITVALGKNNTVTWINQDDIAHGIASDKGGKEGWGSPGSLKPGESFSVTFNSTGVYDYHGQPGPWITGSVIVKEELDMIDLESHGNMLDEINQQAIIHQENEDQEKFDGKVIQMQEKITEIAQDSLGLDVFMSDDDSYRAYFPLIDKSKIEIPKGKESFQICNVAENIPVHLQNIGKTERFQLFAEKYSDYSVELFLQDERRGDSLFHYGLIANSDDGRTALTHFHVDSCTNQITDSERYYISCHNDAQYKVFSTINKDDVLAILSHPDFCTIPLDSWRQSVYDYNQKIKEQLENHLPTIETSDKSYESVSAYQLESHRLDLLVEISSMYVMAIDDEQDIEEKIRQYNNQFGSLPEELLRLIEQRR